MNQPEHDEIDNEDDLLQIDRSDDDLNESGKILIPKVLCKHNVGIPQTELFAGNKKMKQN